MRLAAFQVGGIATLTLEDGLAFGRADTRMIQVDVGHHLVDGFSSLVLLESDQERPARDQRRHIARIPRVALQEQVFIPIESEQRKGLGLAEESCETGWGIRAAHGRILWGKTRTLLIAVSELGGEAGSDLQILVGDIIEQYVSGHRLNLPLQQRKSRSEERLSHIKHSDPNRWGAEMYRSAPRLV
jgi:hypothetical protein